MLAALAAALLAAGARAQSADPDGGPLAPEEAPAAEEAAPDTAGLGLPQLWARVRETYPDAVLLSIHGRTGMDGGVICDPRNPLGEGWLYHFLSASKERYLLMGRCGSAVAGPLEEFFTSPPGAPIEGKFIDVDRALRVLRDSGAFSGDALKGANPLPLGAGDAPLGGGSSLLGRRPVSATLLKQEEEGGVVYWEVKLGRASFKVDAESSTVMKPPEPEPEAGPLAPAVSTAPAARGPGPAGRPVRAKVYTAKRDHAGVAAFSRRELRGAALYAVDAIADAWGGATCFGGGDGWAYYYLARPGAPVDAVYACDGQVGRGRAGFIPFDARVHAEIRGEFIDSDRAMDLLLEKQPNLLDEGMGRFFTRKVSMRLLRYRRAPLRKAHPDAFLFWHVDGPGGTHLVEAARGFYAGLKPR